MHLEFQRTPEGPTIVGWPEALAGPWPAGAALVVLGEPFSFPADWLLERLNADRPGVPVIGGMASGAHGPGKNRVAIGKQFVHERSGGGSYCKGLSRCGPSSLKAAARSGAPLVITKTKGNLYKASGGGRRSKSFKSSSPA